MCKLKKKDKFSYKGSMNGVFSRIWQLPYNTQHLEDENKVKFSAFKLVNDIYFKRWSIIDARASNGVGHFLFSFHF
jgi:hypothetical protein